MTPFWRIMVLIGTCAVFVAGLGLMLYFGGVGYGAILLLLIGAALAMLWSSSRAGRSARRTGWALDVPAIAGLAVIVLMTWRVGQYSPFLYQGGMVLLSLATAAAVAAVACPSSIDCQSMA